MSYDEGLSTRNTTEGNLVRDILYASRENVNFVHEVYRQAFLLSFRYLFNIFWLSVSKIGKVTLSMVVRNCYSIDFSTNLLIYCVL